MVVPTQGGGRFRVYFDGTPSPHEWKSLGRIVEEFSKTSLFNMSIAGVTIGCDSEADLIALRQAVANQFCVPKLGEGTTEAAKEGEIAT